ncbi:MAG: hypothetical protein H0W67_04385 [Gemmatimonadales bacterium]|nr:hypothetical protein [Gemmatimonadales bacterium]
MKIGIMGTGNYYPNQRDGRIEAIYANHLLERGRKPGRRAPAADPVGDHHRTGAES